MRLWIFSDLHLETGWLENIKVPDADVCVVAGDVDTRGVVPSIEWLAATIAPKLPVVFVAGNHEYYRAFLREGLAAGRAAARGCPNLHFLEDDCVEMGDVVFIGSTLWTDFELFGVPAIAMRHAHDTMNDYRSIGWSKRPFSKLKPLHTRQAHARSIEFIGRSAVNYKDVKKVVIVSHHAPSMKSIPPEFKRDLTSAAYASNLEPVIKRLRPTLWVHGHIHQRLDYKVGRTRVLCNPVGYKEEEDLVDFDPKLVVEV